MIKVQKVAVFYISLVPVGGATPVRVGSATVYIRGRVTNFDGDLEKSLDRALPGPTESVMNSHAIEPESTSAPDNLDPGERRD